jgi:arsenical pump membrane protein
VLVWLGLVALVAIIAARPHGRGPALGALVGAGLALAGAAELGDLRDALDAQWRAYVILIAVMVMTSAAEAFGLLDRLAARIEPRTRGPVRHAFRVTFVLSALAATALSNDAAVLLLPPVVLTLLRTVYPKRYPKFEAPFAFAVFAAAGVAPLVISNPMNLVMADHLGIGFNRYALAMAPVALVGWIVTYQVLFRCFRDVLRDEAPALGAWDRPPVEIGLGGRLVLVAVVLALGGYPVMSFLEAPLWPVAAGGAAVCLAVRLAAGHRPRDLVSGVTWSIFPFLVAVFTLAQGLDRLGVVDRLVELYRATPAPLATVGGLSAVGSALLNNHPMSVLNGSALARLGGGDALAFAALVGGDLGPRLLPLGSLAALLWFDVLRRHGLAIRVGAFVRVGVALTIPTLVASLATLWLVAKLLP